MKLLSLILGCLLLTVATNAQRFLPVFTDPDSLFLSRQMHDALGDHWIADAGVINDELVVISRTLEPGMCAFRVVGDDLIHMDDFLHTDNHVRSAHKLVSIGDMTFVCGRRMSGVQGETIVKVHNGVEWTDMGSLPTVAVYDFTLYNGNYLAAVMGGDGVPGIFSWNGEAWEPFEFAILDRVYTLEVYNGVLYAGGNFQSINSQPIQYLAKLGDDGWEEVGSGVNHEVYHLYEFNNLLYCGGRFTADATESIEYPGLLVIANAFNVVPDWAWETSATSSIGKVRFFDDAGILYLCAGGMTYLQVNESWAVVNNELYTFQEHQVRRVITHNEVKYAVNSSSNVSGFGKVMYRDTPLLRERADGQVHTVLHNNNIWAWMTTSPTQLSRPWQRSGFTTEPSFNPSMESRGVLFTAGFWTAGVSDGTIYGADPRYLMIDPMGEQRITTFGPYSESYDEGYLNRYYRIWALTREMIETHQVQFANPDYTVPEVILNYPANGRSWCNESNILAPFADLNGNGIYEPLQGEYPLIHGDRSVITLTNEGMLENNGAPGSEAVIEYYLFDTDDPDIAHTLFVHANIRNRSGRDYEDFAVGYFADFDIGRSTDDFVGSNPSADYFYGYNGDEFDEPSNSSPGYGYNVPACGVRFLNRPLDAFKDFFNSFHPVEGIATTSEMVHHMLHGRFNDGTPMQFGDLGLPDFNWEPDSIVTHRFSDFPWEPFPAWSEQTVGLVPQDRRGVGSTFIGDFPDRSSICVDLAIVVAFPADSMIVFNEVEMLDNRMTVVKEFYDAQSVSCFWEEQVLNVTEPQTKNSIRVFPNPNNGVFTMTHDFSEPVNWSIYTLTGQIEASGVSYGASETFSLGHLAEGFYLLVALTAKGEQQVEKFLIRR